MPRGDKSSYIGAPRPSKPLTRLLSALSSSCSASGRPNQWAPMWVTRQNGATSPVKTPRVRFLIALGTARRRPL